MVTKPEWNANTWNPWEEDSESEDLEVIEDLVLALGGTLCQPAATAMESQVTTNAGGPTRAEGEGGGFERDIVKTMQPLD